MSCWAFHIAGPREPCRDGLARCWGAKKNAGHKRQAFVEVLGARASRAWLGAGSTHAVAALVRQSGCAIQAFGVQPCPLCPCPSCLLLPNPRALPVPPGSLRTPAFLPAPARGALHTQQGCPFPPPPSQPSVFPRQRLPTILTSAHRDLSIFCDTEYPLAAGSGESQHPLPTSLHVAVCRGSGRHKVTSGDRVPRGTEMCQPRQLMQTPLLLLGERCQARMQLTAGCCREGRGWARWGKADHRV